MTTPTQFADSVMNTYARLPVAFERGQGAWLYDSNEEQYLDAISGIGVVGLGHAHPAVTRTIQEQAGKLLHTSNLYHITAQSTLAQELTSITGMSKAFFCNSGAEANEAAIKLARLYGNERHIDQPQILVMERAFHGRTLATLSASGNRKIQAGFEPLVRGFVRAPLNDIDALFHVAKNNKNIVAILFETIQGEGGVHLADTAYLEAVRTLCDEQNWLMMLDEVQSGNGRTGKYFAYQHSRIQPDVVVTAKGLGNGIPIGVMLTNDKTSTLFKPGHHGSTFGGNPFACTVAQTVVKTLFNDRLIERAATLGERMLSGLQAKLEGADYIVDIRGKGLMIGIEMTEPCTELTTLGHAQKILINVTNGTTVRLLPPLILSDDEADHIVNVVCKLLKTYAGDDRRVPRV
ncbi:MAG: aspartate aminotransferase family protein [Gammaproteobacteria bacterium]